MNPQQDDRRAAVRRRGTLIKRASIGLAVTAFSAFAALAATRNGSTAKATVKPTATTPTVVVTPSDDEGSDWYVAPSVSGSGGSSLGGGSASPPVGGSGGS